MAAMLRADPQRSWLLELGDSAFGTLEDQLEAVWKAERGAQLLALEVHAW